MPARELRETTLLSLWMSDIIDLLHMWKKCYVLFFHKMHFIDYYLSISVVSKSVLEVHVLVLSLV